jgi:hypothetical protein
MTLRLGVSSLRPSRLPPFSPFCAVLQWPAKHWAHERNSPAGWCARRIKYARTAIAPVRCVAAVLGVAQGPKKISRCCNRLRCPAALNVSRLPLDEPTGVVARQPGRALRRRLGGVTPHLSEEWGNDRCSTRTTWNMSAPSAGRASACGSARSDRQQSLLGGCQGLR